MNAPKTIQFWNVYAMLTVSHFWSMMQSASPEHRGAGWVQWDTAAAAASATASMSCYDQNADGLRNVVSGKINHITLYTDLDVKCNHRATSIGRYWKHIATQTNRCCRLLAHTCTVRLKLHLGDLLSTYYTSLPQIHNKSNRWSLSLSSSIAFTVIDASHKGPSSMALLTSRKDGRRVMAKFL